MASFRTCHDDSNINRARFRICHNDSNISQARIKRRCEAAKLYDQNQKVVKYKSNKFIYFILVIKTMRILDKSFLSVLNCFKE